jgi:hypothetical protein
MHRTYIPLRLVSTSASSARCIAGLLFTALGGIQALHVQERERCLLTAVGGSPAGHWFAAASHSPSPSCERRCERSCVYPHFGGPRTAQSPQTSRTRCGTSLPPFSARPELPLQRFRACSRSQLRQQRTADAHIVSSSLPEPGVSPVHSTRLLLPAGQTSYTWKNGIGACYCRE